jgi:hypothetical protein
MSAETQGKILNQVRESKWNQWKAAQDPVVLKQCLAKLKAEKWVWKSQDHGYNLGNPWRQWTKCSRRALRVNADPWLDLPLNSHSRLQQGIVSLVSKRGGGGIASRRIRIPTIWISSPQRENWSQKEQFWWNRCGGAGKERLVELRKRWSISPSHKMTIHSGQPWMSWHN